MSADKSFDLAIYTLSLNYRYHGAWQEVGVRIAQRQNAVAVYVTLSSAFLTILAASKNFDSPIDVNYLSLLMPALSAFLALLNFKHDKTIALLREFLRECEQSGAAAQLKLIGYNSDADYRDLAETYRSLHDWAAAILIAVFNGLGILIAKSAFPTEFDYTRWPIVVYGVVVVLCIVGVMHSTLFSRRFEKQFRAQRKQTLNR